MLPHPREIPRKNKPRPGTRGKVAGLGVVFRCFEFSAGSWSLGSGLERAKVRDLEFGPNRLGFRGSEFWGLGLGVERMLKELGFRDQGLRTAELRRAAFTGIIEI